MHLLRLSRRTCSVHTTYFCRCCRFSSFVRPQNLILFPCLPNKALIPRANMMTYTKAVPSTPSAYSIVIFLYKIKPQSALCSKFSHQQQLSWMQLRQASRDKLHIKAAPDEIWSILIASGSAECLILLTTAADDIWGELHRTRSQQPERLYNYQHSETQGDLVLSECRVAALKK